VRLTSLYTTPSLYTLLLPSLFSLSFSFSLLLSFHSLSLFTLSLYSLSFFHSFNSPLKWCTLFHAVILHTPTLLWLLFNRGEEGIVIYQRNWVVQPWNVFHETHAFNAFYHIFLGETHVTCFTRFTDIQPSTKVIF
jgi:hypothetical protein